MAELFMSYAREDQGFARDIHAALQTVNRDTWIDWRSIPDSAKWRAEIFAAIEAADNFLFVISPDSVKSWMCGQEVSHAVANNKRLITVLYHSVEAKELFPALAETQWIDYPNLGFEQTFERLITAIATDLNWVRKHTQFLVRATGWESKDRDQGFLLHGMELKEAVRWLEQAAAIKGRKRNNEGSGRATQSCSRGCSGSRCIHNPSPSFATNVLARGNQRKGPTSQNSVMSRNVLHFAGTPSPAGRFGQVRW